MQWWRRHLLPRYHPCSKNGPAHRMTLQCSCEAVVLKPSLLWVVLRPETDELPMASSSRTCGLAARLDFELPLAVQVLCCERVSKPDTHSFYSLEVTDSESPNIAEECQTAFSCCRPVTLGPSPWGVCFPRYRNEQTTQCRQPGNQANKNHTICSDPIKPQNRRHRKKLQMIKRDKTLFIEATEPNQAKQSHEPLLEAKNQTIQSSQLQQA